jgi:hypothetical protein
MDLAVYCWATLRDNGGEEGQRRMELWDAPNRFRAEALRRIVNANGNDDGNGGWGALAVGGDHCLLAAPGGGGDARP